MMIVAATLLRRVRVAYAVFAVALICFVTLVATTIGTYGALTESAWNVGAASSVKWFIGSIALMLFPAFLRQYVANGVTRQEFIGGGLLFGLASAAGFALLTLTGFGVERLAYGAAGLMDGLTEPYPVDSAGAAAAVLVRAFLIYSAHVCSGWLIGIGFYRYGPFAGMMLILPAVLPALGSETLFGTEWSRAGSVKIFGVNLDFTDSALLTAAIVAAGFAVVYRLGRSVPIRGKIT